MAVIRVVLAVLLSAALFGVAMPSVEQVDRERTVALALAELEQLGDTAEQLAAENDPVHPSNTPPATSVTLVPPEPTVTDSGRFRLADGALRWEPATGRDRTVEPAVPIRITRPTTIAERTRVRLALIQLEGDPVVRMEIERGRV